MEVATTIGIMLRGHKAWTNGDPARGRTPEARHPDSGRTIVAVDPNVTRAWTNRSHHHDRCRSRESKTHRNARTSQGGTRQKYHRQHCFFHCAYLLAPN